MTQRREAPNRGRRRHRTTRGRPAAAAACYPPRPPAPTRRRSAGSGRPPGPVLRRLWCMCGGEGGAGCQIIFCGGAGRPSAKSGASRNVRTCTPGRRGGLHGAGRRDAAHALRCCQGLVWCGVGSCRGSDRVGVGVVAAQGPPQAPALSPQAGAEHLTLDEKRARSGAPRPHSGLGRAPNRRSNGRFGPCRRPFLLRSASNHPFRGPDARPGPRAPLRSTQVRRRAIGLKARWGTPR